MQIRWLGPIRAERRGGEGAVCMAENIATDTHSCPILSFYVFISI
jgi:hypothetical protein